MLTLYGVYRSRASRPLWLLGEIGMPFRHVPVIQAYRLAEPLAAGAPLNTAQAEFLAVNPQGLIPAMEDDGLVMTESMAITNYIARRHGGDLGPANLREEAMLLQWALVGATGIEGPGYEIFAPINEGRAEVPEARAKMDAAARQLRRPFAGLEAALQGSGWLVGGRFTAADIMVAECVRYAQGHPTLMAEFPAVATWLARCHSRPSFKTLWAARLAEPA